MLSLEAMACGMWHVSCVMCHVSNAIMLYKLHLHTYLETNAEEFKFVAQLCLL
jgi:hypothetical protein